MASPPPIHKVAKPLFTFVFCSAKINETIIRAPLAPICGLETLDRSPNIYPIGERFADNIAIV